MQVTRRYQAIYELWDRNGRQTKDLVMECDAGRQPTVGDYLEALKREGLDLMLTDYTNMTFRPEEPSAAPVTSVRILRTVPLG